MNIPKIKPFTLNENKEKHEKEEVEKFRAIHKDDNRNFRDIYNDIDDIAIDLYNKRREEYPNVSTNLAREKNKK